MQVLAGLSGAPAYPSIGGSIPRLRTGRRLSTGALLAETTIESSPTRGSSRRLVRGSTLLLAGRLASKLGNFGTQVLIVRYLTKSDFGAFMYAMSIVTLVQSVVMLGLDRSIVRFLPIYHENRQNRRLLGTIAMTVFVIFSLSVLSVVALHAGHVLFDKWIRDEQARRLLYVLIFLAPLQALDDVMIGIFAVFARPREIFFRRYILAPALTLLVVLALVLTRRDVVFLTYGYLAASLLGFVIYSAQLVTLLRQQELLEPGAVRNMEWPWREVFSFTFPLLTTELVAVCMSTVNVVMLERFWDTSAVASLRAVQPSAKLNELVMASFATLFTPMAARLFATRDRSGIDALYWRSAIWIAIFTFPVFLVTFSMAQPITVLLFGTRYQSAGPIMAMLSIGYYFNAALGFNGLTLKVFGRLRYVIWINAITAAVSVVLSLLLVPKFGALGAAVAMLASLVLHNILKQAGLVLGTGVHLFEWRYLRVYALMVVLAAGLFALPAAGVTSIPVNLALAAVASIVLIRVNARMLDLDEMFPEILRWPGVRWLLGRPRATFTGGGDA